MILRAAEAWAPDDALPENTAVVARGGRVLVQFADGSTGLHDADNKACRAGRPPRAVANVGTELAELLVIIAI